MNEVIKTILERRSVRKFSDKPIEEEKLKLILDAAMHAPSGQCRKTWRFTVVTNQDMIKKLEDAAAKDIPYEGYTLHHPAAFVIPTNLRDNPFGKEDNSIAIMNMMIAAQSLGIGSVWINQFKDRSDMPNIRDVFNELGIPEDHIAYGTVIFGYPADDFKTAPYREKGEIVYIK